MTNRPYDSGMHSNRDGNHPRSGGNPSQGGGNYSKRPPFNRGGARPPFKPAAPPLTQEERDAINVLYDQVEEFSERVNRAEKALFNTEPMFRDEYQNKPVTLILVNGTEITGTLLDIDKYKIILEIKGTAHYYFKQSVQGYYVPSNESVQA